MATWPVGKQIDWDAEPPVCDPEEGDLLVERDNYLRDQILAHTHSGAGSGGSELAVASESVRAGLIRWTQWKSIAAGASAVYYLTITRLSSGSSAFSAIPFIQVLRGPTAGGSITGIGHTGSGNYQFYWRLAYVSGKWQVTVYNMDPSTTYGFWVLAEGV